MNDNNLQEDDPILYISLLAVSKNTTLLFAFYLKK